MKNKISIIIKTVLLAPLLSIYYIGFSQPAGMNTVRVNEVEIYPNYQGNAIIDFSKSTNTLNFNIILHRIPLIETNKYENPKLKFSLVYQDQNKEIELNSSGIFESNFSGAWASLNNFTANINTNEIDLVNGKIFATLTDYYESNGVRYKPTNIGFVNKDKVSLPFPYPMPNAWSNNYNKNGSKIADIGNIPESFKKYANAEIQLLTSNGNQSLSSPEGKYVLVLQSDGNLVIYRSGTSVVMWATNVYLKNPSVNDKFALYIQKDGNLVIYKQNASGQYKTVFWAANTSFVPGNDSYFDNVKYGFYLLQDDGNFVLYYPQKTNSGMMYPIAATNSGNNIISKTFGEFK